MATAKTSIKQGPKMTLMQEFMGFLREYKVLALAIAFIIGTALTALVNAFVNDILMPLITPFLPAGKWQDAFVQLGPFKFTWGHFVAVLINFIIIALVVFMIAKKVMKEEKVGKK